MSVSWIFKLKQSSLIAEPNPSQAYDWCAIIEFDNGALPVTLHFQCTSSYLIIKVLKEKKNWFPMMTWTSDPQVWFFDDLPLSLRENIRLIHVCDRSLKNQQCWKHLLSKWNKKGSKFRLIFFCSYIYDERSDIPPYSPRECSSILPYSVHQFLPDQMFGKWVRGG